MLSDYFLLITFYIHFHCFFGLLNSLLLFWLPPLHNFLYPLPLPQIKGSRGRRSVNAYIKFLDNNVSSNFASSPNQGIGFVTIMNNSLNKIEPICLPLRLKLNSEAQFPWMRPRKSSPCQRKCIFLDHTTGFNSIDASLRIFEEKGCAPHQYPW